MNYINNINMKQIYILLVTICAIAFTACSKDDDSSEDGKEGVITLVHRTDYSASSPVRIQIGAFNKGDIITIDWGDGNVENANLETMCDNIFSTYGIGHRYPNSNPYIITIKGKIRGFWCYTKHITSLDVSGCPALTSLRCYGNNLTSLEVSKNTALTSLDCEYNTLTSLDVSKNTALTKLSCGNNSLTSLDVSKNTALTSLDCGNNSLTSLDISKNTALTYLRCGNNNLSASALNKIFNDLPINDGDIYFNDNPGTDTCDKKILDYKRWECNCR